MNPFYTACTEEERKADPFYNETTFEEDEKAAALALYKLGIIEEITLNDIVNNADKIELHPLWLIIDKFSRNQKREEIQ